jgi:hypothetical protein
MQCNAIIKRVPLGFICGYPLSAGGELYGGSMFIASAANDTLQGRAIQSINERWGTNFRRWTGTETIGIPVCKKKYAPFDFQTRVEGKDGKIRVHVVRMFGCACHSRLRENVIRCHGERKGWEPFGQWSMKKAQVLAKKLTDKLNASGRCLQSSVGTGVLSTTNSTVASRSCSSCSLDSNNDTSLTWKRLCNNGKCAWKLKHKYDDVLSEIQQKDSAVE